MRTIKLTSGKITCLDDEDYHRFGLLVWHADKDGYARRNVKDVHGINHAVYLHRLIVGALSGQKVDHVNRCKWDNSRINLRIVTSSENSQNYPIPKTNTSGFGPPPFGRTPHRRNTAWDPAQRRPLQAHHQRRRRHAVPHDGRRQVPAL